VLRHPGGLCLIRENRDPLNFYLEEETDQTDAALMMDSHVH